MLVASCRLGHPIFPSQHTPRCPAPSCLCTSHQNPMEQVRSGAQEAGETARERAQETGERAQEATQEGGEKTKVSSLGH